MAATNMADSIRTVLREAGSPMTAVEISKKLGKPKKELNQLLYKLTDVEMIPKTQPPQWKIKDTCTSLSNSTPSLFPPPDKDTKGASPLAITPLALEGTISDSELKDKLVKLLTNEGQSAPDLHRKLGDHTIEIKQVKRMLYSSGIATNIAPSGSSKPLYVKAGSNAVVTSSSQNSMPLSLGGNKLYHKIERRGEIAFKEVTVPSKEGEEEEEEEEVKVKPKRGNKEDKIIDNGVSSLSLHEDKQGEETIDDDRLKDLILTHLRDNPTDLFTAQSMSQKLGQPTRDRTKYCLTQLEREGMVSKTNDGGYTLKET